MGNKRNLTAWMRGALSGALMAGCFFAASAGLKEARVTGRYTYYGDGSHTPDECKRMALEGARLQAIAGEFGTVVSQDIVQHDLVDGSGESTYFSALSATEVKGEWLADEGEPEYKVSLDSDGHLVVECIVSGRARELSNESTDFEALVLRNGSGRQFADTRFRSGDDMRLMVKSPVDGYVAVFLVDASRQAYQLLPYMSDTTGEVKVKRGKEYMFFDKGSGDREHGRPDELIMTADGAKEHNKVFVVVSPNRFTLPVNSYRDEGTPMMLSFDGFNRWLAKSRRADTRMGVKVINLEISGNQ